MFSIESINKFEKTVFNDSNNCREREKFFFFSRYLSQMIVNQHGERIKCLVKMIRCAHNHKRTGENDHHGTKKRSIMSLILTEEREREREEPLKVKENK